MKLLATGDWQAGVATVTLDDQEQVWHRIVDVALEHKVDAFLHAGDLVEGPIFTMEQLAAVRRVFARLRKADIPVLILTGNSRHDLAVRPVHALDVFKDYEGINVADSPTVAVLADKVVVCGLPWVHAGRLIAQSNGSLTHEQANETTAEMLLRIARHLHQTALAAAEAQATELPTVLLAHWFVSGSALPTGLPVDQMHEPVLPWADLDAIGFDAVIAGHNHHGQRIDNPALDSTLGIVVGSPQQLNHGEHGEHGCWIIDVPALTEPVSLRGGNAGASSDAPAGESVSPSGSASAEFVPIESKQFVTIDYAPTGEEMPDIPEGAIVRVRYQATEDEARRIDHDDVRHELLDVGASRVTIEPQIIRKERARAQQISEQLSPVDALAAYCDANDFDPDRALAMLARLKEWSEA